VLYFVLVAALAIDRIAELAYSRRNQRKLGQRGAKKVHDPAFLGMVALHVGYFCAAPAEVVLLRRPFLAWVGWPALGVLIAANALRVWSIRALSTHWNMQIVDSQALGAITTGPYRWIRHPNYVALFFEVAALPLVHSAWITAAAATLANLVLLRRRIADEEEVLMKEPGYRLRMAAKPRFFPNLTKAGPV